MSGDLCKIHHSLKLITGPSTHGVGGQTSNGRWRLSSSFVVIVVCCCCRLSFVVCNIPRCNVPHQGAARGGPVVLLDVLIQQC